MDVKERVSEEQPVTCHAPDSFGPILRPKVESMKKYVPPYIRRPVMQWPGKCGSVAPGKSQEGRATGRGTPLSRLPPPQLSFVTPHLTSPHQQTARATGHKGGCLLLS